MKSQGGSVPTGWNLGPRRETENLLDVVRVHDDCTCRVKDDSSDRADKIDIEGCCALDVLEPEEVLLDRYSVATFVYKIWRVYREFE